MQNVSFMTSTRKAHRNAMKSFVGTPDYIPLRRWAIENCESFGTDAFGVRILLKKAHKRTERVNRGQWRSMRKPKNQQGKKKKEE